MRIKTKNLNKCLATIESIVFIVLITKLTQN